MKALCEERANTLVVIQSLTENLNALEKDNDFLKVADWSDSRDRADALAYKNAIQALMRRLTNIDWEIINLLGNKYYKLPDGKVLHVISDATSTEIRIMEEYVDS